MRLTWGVTILCAVIATLIAVALLNPRALPADKILADSVAATSRAPGIIEHTILEIQLEKLDGDAATIVSHTFVEDWQRIGDTLDGHLLTVERITARYAAGDSGQRVPLSWAYETWSQHCFLDLSDTPYVYRDPETDAHGCTTMGQIVQLTIPGAVFQAAEAGPQTWAGRLQVNPARIEDHKSTFQGKPVYSLTEQNPNATLTLYVDRKTYLPVGFVAETPEYRLTQIVHTYEIISPDSSAVDPFAWPPAAIADDDIQPNPGPQDLR